MLHDRFGNALEEQAGDAQQLTEILAHHAERAFTLSSELEMEGPVFVNRAVRARDWALAMAERARTRQERELLESTLGIVRAAGAALPDGGGLEARAKVRLLEAQLLVMRANYAEADMTAAEAADDSFTVSLIPETLERTNIGAAGPGTNVNLEVDVLAKYVERLVASDHDRPDAGRRHQMRRLEGGAR